MCFLFPYPPAIAFLLVYTFFQAYAYYGVSSILVLFFSSHLGYGDAASVSFVHYFLSATFFFSIPGAPLSSAFPHAP
jgi:solute carrier family 15 oligopeptide transporter 1